MCQCQCLNLHLTLIIRYRTWNRRQFRITDYILSCITDFGPYVQSREKNEYQWICGNDWRGKTIMITIYKGVSERGCKMMQGKSREQSSRGCTMLWEADKSGSFINRWRTLSAVSVVHGPKSVSISLGISAKMVLRSRLLQYRKHSKKAVVVSWTHKDWMLKKWKNMIWKDGTAVALLY